MIRLDDRVAIVTGSASGLGREYALSLLDAIEKGQVPRHDLSAFTIRQMQALKDPAVNERVLAALRKAGLK